MCGFLSEFLFKTNTFISGDEFSHLLALSKHRGPDDTQIVKKDNFRLGFNRLAILDLSQNGSQPKSSPSKRYHVVFNGEIYNYQKLLKEHNLGNLKSTSDTEVLVNLLDKLGVKKTLKSLNGMFAITIIDTMENSAYLARDFAGIKPLFYGIHKNGIVSASQFNQIQKHKWFNNNLQLRPDVIKAYFSLGYMLAPDTIYEAIFQVKPNELVTIKSTGNIEKNKILDLENSDNQNKNFDTVLQAAVKSQLVSDVPLGSFLSGGIDSPLITAVAKDQKLNLEAFTLSVKDDVLDESEKAKAYANHLKVKQHLISIESKDLSKEVDTHFKYITEPFGDYSSIPTFAISKAAKTKNTVMLSGDGGDELFFGYPRMLHILKLQRWFKIPYLIRKPLARFAIKLGILDSWAPFNFKNLNAFVKAKQSYINENVLHKAFKKSKYPEVVNSLFNFNAFQSKTKMLLALRQNEFNVHLQRVLIKVDRMSMANSLEVRVPFLDQSVIRYAFDWQPKQFESKKNLKYPLKKLLEKYYPKSIIERKKQGFAVPIEKWLRHELKTDVENTVLKKSIYGNEYFDEVILIKYVTDFFEKKHDEAWGIWHIYAWQKWAINEGLI